jgi:hypothetical protein
MDTSALSLLAEIASTASDIDVQYAGATAESRLNELSRICYRRVYCNEYDAKNREARNAAGRAHGQKESTKVLRRARQKSHRQRSPEKYKAKDKLYLERLRQDPERLENKRGKKRQWEQNKRETDIEFVLRGRLRSRVRMALVEQAGEKAAKTMQLVGTDMEGLRTHLESTFRPGMSWDQLGKGLHIDHIVPLAEFDLKDPAQKKKAFHYTN